MSSKKIIKFKCPFCDKRFKREDLVIHVEEEHEELIPEGFTPLRYIFNYVNKKPLEYHGKCTECGSPTDWDENKGRYNRQCNKPSCKASFIKKFEANMMRTKGVTRISSTAEGQEKMLANRKISGKYKFKNGVEKTYTGSYELKALEFMDQVMNISPDDIMCPGPVLEYTFNAKKHLYITDFYYVPYNLIIEVKDGGKRPNKRDMPEYRGKQIAKEEFIVKNTNYNYLRLTDNDLGQLLSVFADLKMQLVENTGERVIHINEAELLNENVLFNKNDICKDVDKFESGKNNVLLITGFSGSGKSTLAKELAKKYNCDYFELDALEFYLSKYMSLEEAKKGEPALASFIESRNLKQEIPSGKLLLLYEEYLEYLVNWCKRQKSKRFIIEGLQIYEIFDAENPQSFITSNSIIIKGSSAFISTIRAAKRNSINNKNTSFMKELKNLAGWVIKDAKLLDTFDKNINEAMDALMTGYIPGIKDTGSVYIVNYMKNNVFSGEAERGYGISDNCKLGNLICRNKEGVLSKAPDDFLENTSYDVFLTDIKIEEASKKLSKYIGTFVEEGFIYETLFGKKMYTYDQIYTESLAYPVIDYYKGMEIFSNIVESFLKYPNNKPSSGVFVQNENSMMTYDIGKEDDKMCTTYISIKDGKYYVESVDFPELSTSSNNIINNSSDEMRVLKGLLIGGNN